MTITKCDRCGVELPDYHDKIDVKVSRFGAWDDVYELCDNCKNELIVWLTAYERELKNGKHS